MSRLFEGLAIGNQPPSLQPLATRRTSHRVAKADTPRTANCTPALESNRCDRMGRTGVRTLSARELRDGFLNPQYRRELGAQAACETQEKILTQLELMFTEPRDHTIGTRLTDFWQSWQRLAANSSAAQQSAVRQCAMDLVQGIHELDSRLDRLTESLIDRLGVQVAALNDLGREIALINEQSARTGDAGRTGRDVIDKRDVMIDQLSKLTQVQVEEALSGAKNLYIGDIAFVDGSEYHSLVLTRATDARGDHVEIVQGDTGVGAGLSGGEVGALIHALDEWLPDAHAALRALTETLVTRVNAWHRQGETPSGRTGAAFFDPHYITSSSIQLTSAIADSSQQSIVAGRTGARGNVDIARALADLSEQPTMANGRATMHEYFDSMVGTIGVRSSEAREEADTRALLVAQLSQQRELATGGSLDAALVNMVEFQHASEAAARAMTTMDEAVHAVVQGMGTVGR